MEKKRGHQQADLMPWEAGKVVVLDEAHKAALLALAATKAEEIIYCMRRNMYRE